MKINISNLPKDLKKGVLVLAEYGLLEVSERGIVVNALKGDGIKILTDIEGITITYDTKPHFYMALARSLVLSLGHYEIKPEFKRLGFQVDCSRNSVATVSMLKKLICHLSLAGYTYIQLYVEDIYTLEGEEYFGYMRGRYSVEEIREIKKFAELFGLDLVPAVQTLAHLFKLNYWLKYFKHMDIGDIMLVDDENTYALIRKMLSFWVDNFGITRINIGLDEAGSIGRGKFLDKNGYEPKDKIYQRHLKKVFAICDELGIEPEFWGDHFYRNTLPTEEISKIFTGKQTPIFWEYISEDGEFYDSTMAKLREYAGKVKFAGAGIKWFGFAPHNKHSLKVISMALPIAKKHGVEDVLITTWGDQGAECSTFAVMPTIWHTANLVYPFQYNYGYLLSLLTGYKPDEWMIGDMLNTTLPENPRLANACKYMLYNDYLLGLLDANTADDADDYYLRLYNKLLPLSKRENEFSYLFKTYAALTFALSKKATFGKRLQKAYKSGDKNAVEPFISELLDICERIRGFYDAYRTQWFSESKSFGFEVFDARIGSLLHRGESVIRTLRSYIDGKTAQISELEEEHLNYFCDQIFDEDILAARHNQWTTLFTVNSV